MARNPIFGVFKQSPFRMLKEHMKKVQDCVDTLPSFFNAVWDGDWDEAQKVQLQVSALEEEADVLKKKLRLTMPKGVFMPVPRSDLLELLRRQDNVANQARHIAGLVLGRQMEFPEAVEPLYKTFIALSIETADQAYRAISELDDLFESGFRGGEAKVVKALIEKLDDLENQTDKQQIEVRRALFAIENELPPLNAMFLYKVFDWTGELADRAQRVGSHLQLLLAR